MNKNKFGSFGSVIFGFIKAPENITVEKEQSFAEHEVAGGKSLLEWTGEGLSVATLKIKLQAVKVNENFEIDPKKELDDLEKMFHKHTPQPLFCGSRKLGMFVIEKMKTVFYRTDAHGNLVYAEVELTLKEVNTKASQEGA